MTESDLELWDAARAGDEEAFGRLFERHARSVYNHLFRRCADWSASEDMTSVVFLEAWRTREKVVLQRDSALPWLLGVANNVLRNSRRTLRRYRDALARLPAAEGELQTDAGDQVVERMMAEEQMRRVLVAVADLPVREREVLELCVWGGCDYEQAATALEIPVGTVRSRLSRARARLRELEARSGHRWGVHAAPRTVGEVEQ